MDLGGRWMSAFRYQGLLPELLDLHNIHIIYIANIQDTMGAMYPLYGKQTGFRPSLKNFHLPHPIISQHWLTSKKSLLV